MGPTNHRSLKAEAGIKSIADILMKHLTDKGKDWPFYVPFAALTHNSFNSPNLDGHSPMEIAFGRKPRLIPELEIDPDIKVSASFSDHYEKLNKQLQYLRENLQKFRTQRTLAMNQNTMLKSFSPGDIVYMYSPAGARLQTGSSKICAKFVGPLAVYKALSDNQYIIMSLDGKVYPYIIEATRIKAGMVQTAQGNAKTLAELKKALAVAI